MRSPIAENSGRWVFAVLARFFYKPTALLLRPTPNPTKEPEKSTELCYIGWGWSISAIFTWFLCCGAGRCCGHEKSATFCVCIEHLLPQKIGFTKKRLCSTPGWSLGVLGIGKTNSEPTLLGGVKARGVSVGSNPRVNFLIPTG